MKRGWWVVFGLGVSSAGCGSDGSPVAGNVAGGGGAGGSVGSSAGAAGRALGMAGDPHAGLGSVGTGPVACFGVPGDACAPGSVCCERFPFGDDTCESSYAACADGEPLGCDGPSDCPGQKCCAKPVPGPGLASFYGSGCKAACDAATDEIICATTADCAGIGECSQSAESALMTCF